jgi:hypothetical protein
VQGIAWVVHSVSHLPLLLLHWREWLHLLPALLAPLAPRLLRLLLLLATQLPTWLLLLPGGGLRRPKATRCHTGCSRAGPIAWHQGCRLPCLQVHWLPLCQRRQARRSLLERPPRSRGRTPERQLPQLRLLRLRKLPLGWCVPSREGRTDGASPLNDAVCILARKHL